MVCERTDCSLKIGIPQGGPCKPNFRKLMDCKGSSCFLHQALSKVQLRRGEVGDLSDKCQPDGPRTEPLMCAMAGSCNDCRTFVCACVDSRLVLPWGQCKVICLACTGPQVLDNPWVFSVCTRSDRSKEFLNQTEHSVAEKRTPFHL